MKQRIFLILLICFALVSCTTEEEPYLNFTGGQNNSLNFPASGTSETISFSTNYSWTAASSETWLTISPSKGEAGEHSIRISASANTEYETRTATVTISSQGVSQTVSVSQAENNGFVLSTTSFEIGSNGDTIKIPVSANVDYSVEVDKDCESWLSVAKTKGLSSYNIELTATKNDSYDKRIGTIKVKYNSQEVNVTVTQSQLEEMIVGTTSFEIGSKGGELKIPVISSIEYTADVLENSSWIKVISTQTKGLDEYFLVLSIDANSEFDTRVGQVKIKGAGKESIITISQSQLDGFVIDKTEYEISNLGGTIEIPVKSNIEYKTEVINGASSWIKISRSKTKSLEESTISLEIAESKEYDARTGQVKVYVADKESIITIFQSQFDDIIVDTTSLNISCEKQNLKIRVSSNVDYDVEIDANWISQLQTKGLCTDTLFFQVDSNVQNTIREGCITFISKDKTIYKKIKVIQAIKNNYVDIDWNNTTITSYNQETGDLSIKIPDGTTTRLNTNRVIILPHEYNNDIRIINSINKSGNIITLNTRQGNMCHLFKDIEFTLVTNPAMATTLTRSGNNKIITPSEISIIDKNGKNTKSL